MSTYYGVGYRRGGRGLGFQGPYPGKSVPPIKPPPVAPTAPAPGRKPFTIPRFPNRRMPGKIYYPRGLPGRLNRYFKVYYKTIEHFWPELTPYAPGAPAGPVVPPGYSCYVTRPFTATPCPGPDGSDRVGQASYASGCNVINNFMAPLRPPVAPGPTHRVFTFGRFTTGGSCVRFNPEYGFGYATTALPLPFTPYWQPQKKPLYVTAPAPRFTPFPEELPIMNPAPRPLHIPYPLVPLVPDSPWPQGRQTSNGDPQTRAPRPRLTDDPLAGPAVQTDGGPLYPAPPHAFVPPRRGDKERKPDPGRAANAVKGFIDGALGPLTEGADLVGAIHDALPKKAQCRNCTPQGQLKAIYDNFDKLDIPQAIINVALNQAQDAAIGYIGKGVKAGSKNRPGGLRPIGFSTGPGI